MPLYCVQSRVYKKQGHDKALRITFSEYISTIKPSHISNPSVSHTIQNKSRFIVSAVKRQLCFACEFFQEESHLERKRESKKKALKKDIRADYLQSLPGVGKKTAYAILAEVGDFGRFPNRRALASYAGLLPIPRESAEREYERHTSSACNRFLRWAFLETVTGAVRSSPRMKSLHARVRARNPKRPGKARVAVAREVAELAHLLVTRQEKYREHLSRRTERRPARRLGESRIKRETTTRSANENK